MFESKTHNRQIVFKRAVTITLSKNVIKEIYFIMLIPVIMYYTTYNKNFWTLIYIKINSISLNSIHHQS